MDPLLPVDGVLPPDLQGTLLRIGPAGSAADGATADGRPSGGRLHAIELRDGTAVSYLHTDTTADATVTWHAGAVLALAETGLPQQFTRSLGQEEFAGGLTSPIASHTHVVPADAGNGDPAQAAGLAPNQGRRVIFGLDEGEETTLLRVGEWDAAGALAHHQAITLERATWQHDLGVTARHLVLIESPTRRVPSLVEQADPVPYGWEPGEPTWVAVAPRDGDGSDVRWFRLDPCLVTHVVHAHDDGDTVVVYVCCYPVPEKGQPTDLSASVLGPPGIGCTPIGGGLPVLERWRISGERVERVQVDERLVEYPRTDPRCEGVPFRYGYCVELAAGLGSVDHVGLLRVDTARDIVTAWRPDPLHEAGEPLFVRAVDGRADDEGWLLTIVHDATRGASDLYVLDASSLSLRSRPQAVVHLPAALPFGCHGEWVGAERYR